MNLELSRRLNDQLKGQSMVNFLKGFNSEATKDSYYKKLRYFLAFTHMEPDEFLEKSRNDSKFAEHAIIDYVEARRSQVSGSTIHQVRDALKHFYEMNDLDDAVNWAKISKLMPHARKIGSDRAPTLEEVRTIIDNADLRTKCIVLLCCSTGIRLGAIASLTWRDIEPLFKDGDLVAAKLIVYREDPEEYSTFMTPECYHALAEYRKRREAIGELVTPTSPLIRDVWDNNKYRASRKQDPKVAKALSAKAIGNEMGDLLRKVGLRKAGDKKHEFKQVHGFRKFFKTNAERGMKTIDVEKLLGHAENYYKPSTHYLLDEYVKVVPLLTISEAVELKNKLEEKVVVSDRKVGALERENLILQGRLAKIEKDYEEVKELIESRLLTR